MTDIRPERIHELAIEIGARRANDTLDRTPDAVVYRIISDFDDFTGKPDAEVRQDAAEIAELIRTGQSIVTFPHLYEGTGDAVDQVPASITNPEGWEDSWDREAAADRAAQLAEEVEARRPFQRDDRVRLVHAVGPYDAGREGHVVRGAVGPYAGSYIVAIDHAMETICPAAALAHVETTAAGAE